MIKLHCPQCMGTNLEERGSTPSGKQRYCCKDCSKKGMGGWTTAPINLDQFEDQEFDRKAIKDRMKSLNKAKRFVITAAQNATPIHTPFFNNLLKYCEQNNAELICIPYRYKNPTSVHTDKSYDWWDSTILPYIVNQRFRVNENLVILADIKTQPTAENPLSSMERLTDHESAVIGHSKIALQSIATQQGKHAKLLATTGSLTVPNYTNTKLGKKGEKNHCFGAVVIEKDKTMFHMRHLHALNDGSFIDLNKEYKHGEEHDAPPAEALVLGDLHSWWMDDKVDKATFGPDTKKQKSIYNTVQPKRTILHDVIDSYSISHHHGPFEKFTKTMNQKNSIHEELQDAFDYIRRRIPNDVYIVSSNHDDHIRRWIEETNWKEDPVNAEFYLETALHMVSTSSLTQGGASIENPFIYWANKLKSSNVKALYPDESLQIFNVELALHGHNGPNGSRGSPLGLSKIGTRAIVGHYHQPVWKNGLLSVGTSTVLNMSYATGPSSWINSHVVLYANGQCSHIHIIDGQWRSTK